MLANVDGGLLLILCISVFLLGICTALFVLIASIVSSVKSGNKARLIYVLVALACVLTAAASWILNMGWLRFFMTILAIPIVHAMIFLLINNFSASYVNKSARLKIYTVLSYVTYISGYLLLPDASDYGPQYLFFGLIRNDTVANIAFMLSYGLFAANLVVFILQIIEMILVKVKSKEKTERLDA